MERRASRLWAPLLIAVATTGLVLAIGACFDIGYSCPSGLTRCGTSCPDVRTDRTNCGGCGIGCQIGQYCADGGCVCQPGLTSCNGFCTATPSDPFNCGGCAGDGGVVCAADQVCEDGGCGSACVLGTSTRCDPMDGGRPMCVDTRVDPNNCGRCGMGCDGGHCDGGTCS